MYPILWGYHPKRTWRVGEEGYSCISITTCPCINTSNVLWLCLVMCYCLFELKIFCLFAFALNVFTLLILINLFLFYVKNPKTHKKLKIQKGWSTLLCFVSNIFCLVPSYKWPCAFKSVACSLSTSYLCGRNLDIYVTVVNRSSNLSWMNS